MRIKGCQEEATYKLMGNIYILKTLRGETGNVLLFHSKIFIFFKVLSHRRDPGTRAAKTRPQISENDKSETSLWGRSMM